MTDVTIDPPAASAGIRTAIEDLVDALDGPVAIRDPDDAGGASDVLVSIGDRGDVSPPDDLDPEGFAIRTTGERVAVLAPDETGAMYGTFELAERVRARGLDDVEDVTAAPAVGFRAVKFNLPWSPYRGGEQTEVHLDTCRDRDFWEAFLDTMARNRFNALTLWNLHPFPYMVRPENFPEACPFDDDELAEWRDFWRDLFRMADERGIETYVLNWNIVVSPSFADAYDVDERNDRSEVVKEYTRECVAQTVDEYPNLAGLGVSLCDWMTGMTPAEKEDWFLDTVVAGIEDADRSVKLLHRSVLTGSIEEMRRGIDEAAAADNVSEVLVPTKFNWSHGHSTTSLELTHDYSSGKVDDRLWNPEPENYSIAWMVRNEDFEILRWGDPDFVREHVAENLEPYVDGYFVGSEAFVPAVDYSHRVHRHRTWTYQFEKQWLFYAVWGRLLYDPDTPDAAFERAFERRYGEGVGERLLSAYRQASKMPLELASFHAGTWDYTLYSEGFVACNESLGLDDGASPFISIDELVDHETLDSGYVSIPDFVAGEYDGDDVTPPELADRVASSGERALELAAELRSELGAFPGALECELDDVAAWGHLSRYFATKLRAGVALETFRRGGPDEERERAVDLLREAAGHWNALIDVTDSHYREVPYATDWREGETFSWANYRDQVERDVRIAREATRDG